MVIPSFSEAWHMQGITCHPSALPPFSFCYPQRQVTLPGFLYQTLPVLRFLAGKNEKVGTQDRLVSGENSCWCICATSPIGFRCGFSRPSKWFGSYWFYIVRIVSMRGVVACHIVFFLPYHRPLW